MKIKVQTHDLDYQGQGVTRIDDKVTFIKGMFEGEEDVIENTHSKKNLQIGKLLELTKKSEHRVSHKAFDYAPLYGLSLDEELNWQVKTTKETFKKITDLDINVDQIITSH